jgi:hypothetical protein
MESIDSLDNQPSISCGFVETMQLSGGHGGYRRPYGITYTEDGAGSSPVPPTFLYISDIVTKLLLEGIVSLPKKPQMIS